MSYLSVLLFTATICLNSQSPALTISDNQKQSIISTVCKPSESDPNAIITGNIQSPFNPVQIDLNIPYNSSSIAIDTCFPSVHISPIIISLYDVLNDQLAITSSNHSISRCFSLSSSSTIDLPIGHYTIYVSSLYPTDFKMQIFCPPQQALEEPLRRRLQTAGPTAEPTTQVPTAPSSSPTTADPTITTSPPTLHPTAQPINCSADTKEQEYDSGGTPVRIPITISDTGDMIVNISFVSPEFEPTLTVRGAENNVLKSVTDDSVVVRDVIAGEIYTLNVIPGGEDESASFNVTITCTGTTTVPPSVNPTSDPTLEPIMDPTIDPTINPTMSPTSSPTVSPTVATVSEWSILAYALQGLLLTVFPIITAWLSYGHIMVRFKKRFRKQTTMRLSSIVCVSLAFMYGLTQWTLATNIWLDTQQMLYRDDPTSCDEILFFQIFTLYLDQYLFYIFILSRMKSMRVFTNARYYCFFVLVTFASIFSMTVHSFYTNPTIFVSEDNSFIIWCSQSSFDDIAAFEEYAIFLAIDAFVKWILFWTLIHKLRKSCSICDRFTIRILILGLIAISFNLIEFALFILNDEFTIYGVRLILYCLLILLSFNIFEKREEFSHRWEWLCWCTMPDSQALYLSKSYRDANEPIEVTKGLFHHDRPEDSPYPGLEI